MGVRSEGTGRSNNWKILIGLSVLCAALVFLGGFLHRRALDSAIADRQAKSVAFVNTKVAAAAKHANLAHPMKDAEAARFTKQINLPTGTDLRLFSNAGVPLYSSPGLASFAADTEGIQTAVAGDQGRVVDGSDLRIYAPVEGNGAKPVAIAAVISNYAQLRHDVSGPLDAVRLPIVGLGIVLLIAGLLLMLQATKGNAAAKAPAKEKAPSGGKRTEPAAPSSSKRRITGFDPVPVTVGRSFDEPDEEQVESGSEPVRSEGPVADVELAGPAKTVFGLRLPSKKQRDSVAPAEVADTPASPKAKRSLFAKKAATADAVVDASPQDDKASSALDREVAIRQALEDQLEQLRTRIQMQDVETNNATQELLAQLEAANRRAEQAEARANDAGGPAAPAAPAPADAALRVQQLERELAEGRSVTADAISRAETLQRQLDELQAAPVAPTAPAADPNAEARVAEAMGQLADAQQRATGAEQRASAAEQRAASVESVRDELEVRVAQLGTKASDLEQRATELETSLNEANAGGDAVRAEIATLTAALAAANARVSELESAPAASAAAREEDQAEIARLRGELANHMERAQSAEERATTLEADLLAAQRGVSELSVEEPRTDDVVSQPAPVHAVADEVSLASRFAPDEPDVQEPEVQEPEVHEQVSSVQASANPEPEVSEDDDAASQQTASVNPWGSLVPAARTEHDESEPVSFVGENGSDRDAAEPAGAVEDTRSPVTEVHEPEHVESSVDEERGEMHAVEAAEPEVHSPEPAEAESAAPEPAGSVTPSWEEPAAAVEWHAPSAPTPVVSSPNGNGIPPAPSDDARYDDIWSAAFAPPEPERAHENGDQQSEPVEASHADAEPEPASTAGTEQEAEPTADEVSPDDQPSLPEDLMSAEDEMWSLRARLADAAARKKKLPHPSD